MAVAGLAFAKILRRLADAVQEMDTAELTRFMESLPAPKGRSTSRDPKAAALSHSGGGAVREQLVQRVLSELQTATSREEAFSTLRGVALSRRELMEAARARDVYVTKTDGVSRLEEKLVEATIGSKLNSQAIRGVSETQGPN